MHPDPALHEVREIRGRISERFDHDPRGVIAYYRARHSEYAERLRRGRAFGESPEGPSEPDSE